MNMVPVTERDCLMRKATLGVPPCDFLCASKMHGQASCAPDCFLFRLFFFMLRWCASSVLQSSKCHNPLAVKQKCRDVQRRVCFKSPRSRPPLIDSSTATYRLSNSHRGIGKRKNKTASFIHCRMAQKQHIEQTLLTALSNRPQQTNSLLPVDFCRLQPHSTKC